MNIEVRIPDPLKRQTPTRRYGTFSYGRQGGGRSFGRSGGQSGGRSYGGQSGGRSYGKKDSASVSSDDKVSTKIDARDGRRDFGKKKRFTRQDSGKQYYGLRSRW